MTWIPLAALLLAAAPPADIPSLTWSERSDWTNVCTDVSPAARGDGTADDTAAIQAALDAPGARKAVYLPPGRYRITATLFLNGPTEGALMVGHGRDTTILWDGPTGGRMFVSNGAAYSRYIGISWDGQGRAAVGLEHASTTRFETEVRHQFEAFRHMTGYGIRVGEAQQIASAEILYRDCLFEDCDTGAAFLTFNDYDNTLDGCEFRDCRVGIRDLKGNFYARDCHFERSRATDFQVGSEHGSSIRRCTSVGSSRFVLEDSGIAPLTIQDCHVRAWTASDGTVRLSGSPALLMDCTFTDAPTDHPPVARASESQRLFVSACEPSPIARLLTPTGGSYLYDIPPGERAGVIGDAARSFLRAEAPPEGRVFDAVRDFGARGDGATDDAAPIQAAIDAARAEGASAVAYLPAGRYAISRTLELTGAGYSLEGGGFRCGLVWTGPTGEPLIRLRDARGVRLASLMAGHSDLGKMTHGADVLVESPSGEPCAVELDEVYAYGLYTRDEASHGIVLEDLPAGSVIHGVHVQGNVHVRGCSDALVLLRTSYEGTLTVEGERPPDARGLTGVLMRLATLSGPTLHVRDNQSLAMTDFYNEQSDSHILLEGSPGQPDGAVTIQGAKMHLNTDEPAIELRGFSGRAYYGQSQFYIAPAAPRLVSTDEGRARLIVAGHFWYNTAPALELGAGTRLALVGNRGVPDDAIPDEGWDAEALQDFSLALDDLRRLGEADLATR